ncbi:MAG: glycosyltransferase [Anaerovoracaceae bacterium]
MNILIFTGRFGMGHIKAAGAIAEQLRQTAGDVRVDTVDFMELLFPTLSSGIYKGFQLLVSRCSGLYNDLNRIAGRYGDVPMKNALLRKIDRLLALYQPDLIIATLPICGQYISAYKVRRCCKVPMYTYITDITVHEEWLSAGTDLYFVGDETTRNALLSRGIPSDKILVTGIPVSQAFHRAGDLKAETAAKAKMSETAAKVKMSETATKAEGAETAYKVGTKSGKKKHLLVMGGGLGLIPGGLRLLQDLSRSPFLAITLIAGSNQKLAEQVRAACPAVQTLGYTDQVARYMQQADLLITKPGGITTFEAIASRTPLYVVCPFLEQEKGNAHFIENAGIGRVLWDNNSDVGADLLSLLFDTHRLSAMKENMERLSASFLPVSPLDCYLAQMQRSPLAESNRTTESNLTAKINLTAESNSREKMNPRPEMPVPKMQGTAAHREVCPC